MITSTLQIDQVDRVKTEIASLLTNKEAIAKIINYDSFGRLDINPTDIQEIQIKGDILRFLLTNNRATMLSIYQFFQYWEKIKMNTQSESPTELPTTEKIVELAKEFGTAVWEHGTKLGYVVQRGVWFYAVTEILTHNKGLQYSHSRHGSFYLAQEELRERSWEVEEVEG